MSILNESYNLANGVEIPKLGLGTWFIDDDKVSPIAHGEILKKAEVWAMAGKYGVTVPQLCIRYTLQLGAVSLPKTANPEHMRSNTEVDFVIAGGDMAALRELQYVDYGEHAAFPVYSGK
ncbi:hypothetical protein AB0O52_10840 [Arthrobacter sp. NPDC080073]|uniref:hypothetical protein n=1 Tax=Arthrobacter sp. NPDC080073 TaxID=3155919 RepID=UPI0034275931